MKPLYEKLSQKALYNLGKSEIEYPNTVKAIKKVLKSNFYWSDLTVKDASLIMTYTTDTVLNLTELDQIFTG
tara:strand:+ start:56 stop:271 length:216 start_codon:yes stop_codon:yes gene_type:complete